MATAQSLIVITVAEALDILHSYGMSIGDQTLRAGIRQGVYKFGDYIEMSEGVYHIYLAPLQRWIEDRLVEEEIPAVPTS